MSCDFTLSEPELRINSLKLHLVHSTIEDWINDHMSSPASLNFVYGINIIVIQNKSHFMGTKIQMGKWYSSYLHDRWMGKTNL